MITRRLLNLIEAQARVAGAMSQQTVNMLRRLWAPYRHWTDYDMNLAQAARTATTVEAGMHQARLRERAYRRLVYKELQIPLPSNNAIDEGLSATVPGGVEIYLRGVNPLEVFERPAEEYRYQRSKGLSDAEAIEQAVTRVTTIADSDISLARRDEMRAIYQATPEVLGWRRVIHPELSQDGTSCGLCVVASQRLYKRGDLMPIHDWCNCDTLPVIEGNDPGQELNYDDLRALYDAAGSNTAGDLLNTKVFYTEHGELGSIIAKNRQGAKQRARAKAQPMDAAESFARQIEQLTKSSEKLAKRLSLGEETVRLSLNWQRDRINKLQRQLAAMEKVRR